MKPDKFPVLNAVLFGEGIINDAVAIVLFRTVSNLTIDENNGITYMFMNQDLIQSCIWLSNF